MHEFKRLNVCTLVPRPIGKSVTETQLFFQNKMDEDGIITQKKERLVAHGFTRVESLYYEETFAPIAIMESSRLFLAYAYYIKFNVFHMDT